MRHKRPESVLIVVYTQACEVLMLRRKYPNDFWQSVTGSLEWDEAPLDAAIRELQEETGLIKQELHDCQYSKVFEIYSIWRERLRDDLEVEVEQVTLDPI